MAASFTQHISGLYYMTIDCNNIGQQPLLLNISLRYRFNTVFNSRLLVLVMRLRIMRQAATPKPS
jgi:hypothetical protein